MPLIIDTPKELSSRIAKRVRDERLRRGWTQAEMADRAGIVFETYRAFERTGRISLERLLSIAIVLGRAAEWDDVFRPREANSLDELDAAERLPRRGSRGRRATPRKRAQG